VVALKKAGYVVGIVTDSYHIPAEIIRRRVFADFTVSHLLHFRNGRATGKLTMAQAMAPAPGGCSEHLLCKENVLRWIELELGRPFSNVLSVGDGENDICMLKSADLGVAFEPKSENVQAAGNHVVSKDLKELLSLLPPPSFSSRSESEGSDCFFESNLGLSLAMRELF
jgi:phosphoserine phosphatase